jgi:hypothetical protein
MRKIFGYAAVAAGILLGVNLFVSLNNVSASGSSVFEFSGIHESGTGSAHKVSGAWTLGYSPGNNPNANPTLDIPWSGS